MIKTSSFVLSCITLLMLFGGFFHLEPNANYYVIYKIGFTITIINILFMIHIFFPSGSVMCHIIGIVSTLTAFAMAVSLMVISYHEFRECINGTYSIVMEIHAFFCMFNGLVFISLNIFYLGDQICSIYEVHGIDIPIVHDDKTSEMATLARTELIRINSDPTA